MADSDPIITLSDLKPIDLGLAFASQPAALDYVLPGMIAGTVGALIAPGGIGKSWVALELAIAVAGGPDLLGIGVDRHGSVLYLPAEDPELAIEHRLHAVAPHLDGDARAMLADRLSIVPLMGRSVDLLVPAWSEAICRLGDGRRLIVIDTLRRFHVADENSGGDMSRLLAALETLCLRTGASVLFLHHTTKGSSLNGGADQQQASRGSSVLVDNIRGAQLNLSPMSDAEAQSRAVTERKSYVRLSQSKSNFGAALEDRWLRRTDGGLLLPAEFDGVGGSGERSEAKDRNGWRRRA